MLFKEVKNLISGSILVVDLKQAETHNIPFGKSGEIDTWDNREVYCINGSIHGDIHILIK